MVEDVSCLLDCFSEPAGNCVSALLHDIIARGVCRNNSEVYPVFMECDTKPQNIIRGTCSDITEELLVTEACKKIIAEQQHFILYSILVIIRASCRTEVWNNVQAFIVENTIGKRMRKPKRDKLKSHRQAKLAPAIFVGNGFRTKLEYENTLHRYPWVCSLRSTGSSAAHRCAVTLLSIPPSPTIFTGAAHCTYICKDGAREVPGCCCQGHCGDNPKCGRSPRVEEMMPQDSVILCGEFDTSQASYTNSGERYNIEFPILKIVRHPGFSPSEGPLLGSDIVIFKVDDRVLKNNAATNLHLWPACLPENKATPSTGIQTGWSQPPPFPFIESEAPGYAPIYSDFYKQWHYKLDILDTCEDPKYSPYRCYELRYPSNSSYPPGTLCAKDFTRQSCFTTGDSGSPLLVQYEDSDRFHLAGILSSVKGCGSGSHPFRNTTSAELRQVAENPTIFTKLSCYLPWIAAQYNMEYQHSGVADRACQVGAGDPHDGQNPCRSTPSRLFGDEAEVECKFPFYYKGVKYEECILFIELEFTYPVFRCPTRRILVRFSFMHGSTLYIFTKPPSFNFNSC